MPVSVAIIVSSIATDCADEPSYINGTIPRAPDKGSETVPVSPVTPTQYFGATEKILSGSDHPLMIFVTAENQQFPGAGANPGSVNIYQTSSNISTWNYLTGTTANEGFARGMDVTRYENSIYIVGGAPGYDIPAADVGRGYLYKWDLVVSGS